MKTEIKKKKLPKGYTRNTELDKYVNKVLFKEKLEKATEFIKIAGVPKE